jgi:hypothetical protein
MSRAVSTVTLFRLIPPFRKRVRLERITVQGFLDLLGIWVARVNMERQAGHEITEQRILTMNARVQFVQSADLFTPDLPGEWFAGWASDRNNQRMLRALALNHNWGRIFTCLDLTGQKRKGPGLMGDVMAVSRITGASPWEILNWPMEDFIERTEMLARAIESEQRHEDPTLDPNCDATPASELGIPGMEIIH